MFYLSTKKIPLLAKNHKMYKNIVFALIATVCLQFLSCVESNNQFSKLAPGEWRALLTLENNASLAAIDEEVTTMNSRIELPFNFEVIYEDESNFYIELINGEERIRVDDISYGRDHGTAKDTVTIRFPMFDTYIKGIYVENVFEGYWHVNYRDNYKIPFVAYHGQDYRFSNDGTKAGIDINGNWKAIFSEDTEDEYPAIGEFVQNGNQLLGTFMTETGDYRYLEGEVKENKFYMSCFDGSHAFLFEGKQMEDESLIGTFYSGIHHKELWVASKDPLFKLGDAYSLTKSKIGDEALSFSFPNADQEIVSINDEEYKGKVKLIKIMGTWCPNCKDETSFLLDYLQNNPNDHLEVIAISFERYREEDKSFAAIKRFKDKMNIPYEVLYGGYYDKAEAVKQMPQIDKILSYPTLLYVDKNNKIRKIYTGFSGPATSAFSAFKEDFSHTVNELLSEI